jgi:hypothetical protein
MVHIPEWKAMFLDSFASIMCLGTAPLNWLRHASCLLFGGSMQNYDFWYLLDFQSFLQLSSGCSGNGQIC